MCIIQMYIEAWDRFFEASPKSIKSAEHAVADLARYVLSSRFGKTTVDRVTINFSSDLDTELQLCSIQIDARSPKVSLPLHPQELDNLEFAVEDIISRALLELFETVSVDKVFFRAAT